MTNLTKILGFVRNFLILSSTAYYTMGKTTFFKMQFGVFHLVALLLLINVLVIYFFDMQISRIMRLVSCIALIGFLIIKGGINKNVLILSLGVLLLRDIAILSYETPIFKTLSMVCTIFIYTSICFFTLKRLPMVRFSMTLVLVGLGIILLNIFNVYYLSDIIISSLDSDAQLILFFTQSAVMLFMALFAFLYNETFEGKQSLQLLICVIAFIFSDLGGLASYFFGYEPAFYAERIFYLVAAAYLVDYILNYQPEADQLSELSQGNIRVE